MTSLDGPSSHLEVERKFDVADAAPLPALAEIAAVAEPAGQVLDAVYFDTPTGALAARRVTLRRRTGGDDAGWHLKLPAGPDRRTELRAPLGGDAQPAPDRLLDVVRAIVRDQPVGPVARVTTHRDVRRLHGPDGTVLAEFCDDRVTTTRLDTPDAGTQRWREWEFELVDGGMDLLERCTAAAGAAGAVRSGYGSKLARALGTAPVAPGVHRDPLHRGLAEQVEALLGWDRAVRADADDSVHQLRVTTRKIRSLLKAAAKTLGPEQAGPAADELRWLAGVLGVARDAEVLAQRYRDALAVLPPELVRGPVTDRLVVAAEQRYRAGWQESLAALRSVRYFRLLDALDALVAGPAADGAAPARRRTVAAAYRRVRKATKAATRATPAGTRISDEALHRIRKGAKRLRYTASATGAAEVSRRAKAVQTLLGDNQDSVVSRAHLLVAADAAHAAGEDTFTYGLLYQQEQELADSCHAQLDGVLTALADAVRAYGGRVGL